MQGSRVDHHAPTKPALVFLSKLASANLAAFGRLLNELRRAFPNMLMPPEGPPVVALSAAYDLCRVDLHEALAAATSRGLEVITPLLNSSSSCLLGREEALLCVLCCLSLSICATKAFVMFDSSCKALQCPAEVRRRQVQMAVILKSAGACQPSRVLHYSKPWNRSKLSREPSRH
jgi:hypothetical protein